MSPYCSFFTTRLHFHKVYINITVKPLYNEKPRTFLGHNGLVILEDSKAIFKDKIITSKPKAIFIAFCFSYKKIYQDQNEKLIN